MSEVVATCRLLGHELQVLSKIVEQATEGVAVIDLDGIVRFVNIRWAEMHGYSTTGQLLGKHIRMFHTKGQMQNDLVQMLDETRRRGLIIGPIDHTKRSGRTFPTQTKIVLLSLSSKPSGFIILAVDCTDSRKNAAQLREKSAELNEMKEATEQIKQAEECSRRHAAELEQQLEEQAAGHRRLQGQLREQVELLERQSAELTQLGEAKKRLEGETSEHQKLASELHDIREQAEEKIAKLTQEREQLRQEVAGYKEAEEQLRRAITELEQKSRELEQGIGEAEHLKGQPRDQTQACDELKEPLEQHVGELVDAKAFASEILGVSRMRFRLMRARGRIGPRPIKVNGNLRWELSSILRWIEWNCCKTGEFKARELREFEQIPEESQARPPQISSVHMEERGHEMSRKIMIFSLRRKSPRVSTRAFFGGFQR